MIERDEVLARQEVARAAAEAAGYAAVLVIGRSFYDRPGDLAYLTNHFPPFPSTVFTDEQRGFGHGIFLLPVRGQSVLLTDPRKHRSDLVAVDDVRPAANLSAATVDLLRERSLDSARVGMIGDDILPAAMDRDIRTALPSLDLVPDSTLLADMRVIKSPAEQEALRRAAEAADAALTAAVDRIRRPGATEREICAAGIEAAMRNGADFVRYMRVHSGPWSSFGSRWPQATERALKLGDLVVLDAIGALDGYGFDVNRSLSSGPTDAERLQLLETVHEALLRAVDGCRAGNVVADVVDAAVNVIGRSPFANAFSGMMGHGIGLETVELPLLTAGNGTELRAGMVLCVEPGLFVPNWGGALIEQEVIVRESGPPEVITTTPTRLWDIA